MDGSQPGADPLDLTTPLPPKPYEVPAGVQRFWVSMKAISWRVVAIPIFLLCFVGLFLSTVGPLFATEIGKWSLTAIFGAVLAFLMWPKTLARVFVGAFKAVASALRWLAKVVSALTEWISKTIWAVLSAIGKAIRYLARRFWAWISQLTILDWCFIPLWTAVVAAWITLLFWDAKFYAGLAEPGLEASFMAAGVVFRLFVIFGGLAIVWVKMQGAIKSKGPWLWFTRLEKVGWKRWIPVPHLSLSNAFKGNVFGASARTLRIIWAMGLVACLVAAMGFVTDGNDFHYRKAESIQTVGTNAATSADVTIQLAKDEITRITTDRDRQIAGARQSMNLVLDDGNARNDDVSQYEANIRQYTTDAQLLIEAQNANIAKATIEKLAAQQTATTDALGDPGVKAVFRQPERYVAGVDSVTLRDAFGLFWVILLELCGAVGAQSLVAIQMALAKRRMAQAYGKEGGIANSKAELRKLIEYYNEVSKPKSKTAQAPPDEPADPPKPDDPEVKDKPDADNGTQPTAGS